MPRIPRPLDEDEDEVEEEEDDCLEEQYTDVSVDYKNLPRLCTGTGKSTRVSKICTCRVKHKITTLTVL